MNVFFNHKLSQITSFDDVKFEAASLLARIYEQQVRNYKSADSYIVVETKNNDGLHLCNIEVNVPQDSFWIILCYIVLSGRFAVIL